MDARELSVSAKKRTIAEVTFEDDNPSEFDAYVTKLEPVLADEYTREVQFETAIACQVLDKKNLSNIVKELSTKLPVPRLQHLKRVKKDLNNKEHPYSVLLCSTDKNYSSADDDNETYHLPMLRELCPAIDLPDDVIGKTYTVMVPSDAPLTRSQYEAASAVWPTTFHEDKYISRLLAGDVLTAEELKHAESYMKCAIIMARRGRQLEHDCVNCSDGCVIVDPVCNKLLVAAYPLTKHHPLHHAIMVAVDLVARQQGGGTYTYPDEHLYIADTSKSQDSQVSHKTGPYLCTGYDVYVTREPCIMCSMALVHSRIRRLYYGASSPDGALGTKYKLHVQNGLNHKFEVFKGLLIKNNTTDGGINSKVDI